MPTLARAPAFVVGTISLVTLVSAAGTPAPLYVVYQERYGIPPAGLTGAFAIYILPLVTMLLVCGRLSDHLGRRLVAVVALLLGALACGMFVAVTSTATLLLARSVQGVGVGLGLAALGALVVDLRPPGRPRMAAAVTSVAPAGGIGLGAVVSGALVEYGPWPLTLVYLVLGAALIACAVGVALAPETSARRPGAVRSLRPDVRVPPGRRMIFAAASACFVASWAWGGFYQALGPSVAAEVLGADDRLVGGLVVASLTLASAAAGAPAGRLRPVLATVGGAVVLVGGVAGVVLALGLGSVPGFFAASVIAGLGFGAAYTGAMSTVLDGLDASDRAGVLAAVYLVSYLGAAVPSFLAGVAVSSWGLLRVTVVYGGGVGMLALATAVVAVLVSPRRSPVTTPSGAGR